MAVQHFWCSDDGHQVASGVLSGNDDVAGGNVCDGNGSNGTYGIEEWLYRGTVNLPPNCGNDWSMSWSSCCRNFAITSLTNPGSESMYVDAQLNNTASANCNNSPAFNTDPTFFLFQSNTSTVAIIILSLT